MRTITRLLLGTVLLSGTAQISGAQAPDGGDQITVDSSIFSGRRRPALPGRFVFALDALIAQPKGEFGSYVDKGFGGNLVLMYKLDPAGMISVRADVGGMQYDRERKRVPFLPITGRVRLDVTTSNDVYWGAIGPQLMLATKAPVRPYVNAAVGLQTFVTETSLSGSDQSGDYASTTNSSDATFAYIFGGGFYIPFGRVSSSGSLNIGARYHFGGTAKYLRKGDIIDNADGSITLNPVSSKTDVIMWQVGFSLPLLSVR